MDYIKHKWAIFTDKFYKRILLILWPLPIIYIFTKFISSSYGNVIAFVTLMISIQSILFALCILIWILKKDCGSEKMIEIADMIKEGAEGFL